MPRILVLGAYGMIGSHVVDDLIARGHEVVGLGRDRDVALRVFPNLAWVFADLRQLTSRDAWMGVIRGIDVVVNCAGALQTNPRDRLEVVHLESIGALVLACEKADVALVQISAAGADPQSPIDYYRTKGEGDALIRESHARWWIFRPRFVAARSAYGNVTLIRVLAGFPGVLPVFLPEARLQTISADDVALAVRRAIEGQVPPGTIADLVEETPHCLRDILVETRSWLGYGAPRAEIVFPRGFVRVLGRVMDGFGYLGWRSPIRSNVLRSLEQGVAGNPAQTEAVLGRPAHSLFEIRAIWRATAEDRMFARMQLLGPFVTVVLALQTIVSGLLVLANVEATSQLVAHSQEHAPFREALTIFFALATVGVGVALFVRRWTSAALLGVALLAACYVVSAAALMPALWLEPVGGPVGVLPTILLALVARQIMETR